MTPLCSVCGRRPVSLRISPIRNPHSRSAVRGRPVTVRGHDTCRPCWRKLLAPILNAAHAARLSAALAPGGRG
ncbi:MAG: hypothetical protein HYY11_03015 [Candidatus Methylomirabilis oxyfera]|nr:hypothetical protein [Candidatus Methylomirabilis oxyfera]